MKLSIFTCLIWMAFIGLGCAMSPKVLVKRFKPDQDLRLSLKQWAEEEDLKAASIVAAVGSLKEAQLRLSDHKESTNFKGPFEIVSLSGTLSKTGMHVHMSISDTNGKTIGGHLVEGSKIYTTAEITLLEAPNLEFQRQKDEQTGYEELVVLKRK